MAKVEKSKVKSKLDLIKEQRDALKKGGGATGLIFLKADTEIRLRNISTGEHSAPGITVDQFYLGVELKGVISPHSINKPCALMEYYNKLKDSDDEDDHEIAASMSLRQKVLMPVYKYEDLAGKKPEVDRGPKMVLMTSSLYNEWLDWFSDPEKGDASDPDSGYDIKFKREGSTMTSTKYTMVDCKPTPCHKAFAKPIDSEKLLATIVPSYEETKKILAQFLGNSREDDDSEDELREPKKKKKKVAAPEMSKSKTGTKLKSKTGTGLKSKKKIR